MNAATMRRSANTSPQSVIATRPARSAPQKSLPLEFALDLVRGNLKLMRSTTLVGLKGPVLTMRCSCFSVDPNMNRRNQ